MGRRRYKPPLEPRPGRISSTELGKWLQFNGLSEGDLAAEVFVETATVRGWVRGHRHTPAWLEKRINRAAEAIDPRLPFWGKRWPAAKTTAPPADLDETKAPFPFTAPSAPPPARDEPDEIDPITGQPIYYEDD